MWPEAVGVDCLGVIAVDPDRGIDDLYGVMVLQIGSLCVSG